MRYLNCFIVFFLLSACQPKPMQHISHSDSKTPKQTVKSPGPTVVQDGAPKVPLKHQARRIEPKNEPLSRYGNLPAYQVNGKTYNVLTTAHGYHDKGLASWYGTKFHKKRTSSGEDYNLYEYTAAHKTLPLPTYVKVKNLKNGRELIVKVNDRGPFHKDRIIDLSYGAAKKLGFAKTGTALVEVEAISTHENSGKNAQYFIQAGAFSVKKLAEQLRRKVAKMTTAPVFVEPYQAYFIVKAGPFSKQDAAQSLKQSLANQGVKGAFSVLQ